MPSHFKFKEYCPLVFRDLRERFGVNDEEYMDSLTKRAAQDSDSPGRSGARFLLSSDKKYIIKTIGSEEVAEMHRILKEYHQESLTRCQPVDCPEMECPQDTDRFFYNSCDRKFVVRKVGSDFVEKFMRIAKDYHQYVVERHAQTLLPHFLGMYRITVSDNETYMVVMKNIFSPRLLVHKKYDLKGSTVQREASDKEKAKDLPTYKDNDFLNENMRIQIGDATKQQLMANIHADVQFLVQQNLMDYSLLVGVHDLDRAAELEAELLENENEAQEEANGGGSGVGESDEEVLHSTSQPVQMPTGGAASAPQPHPSMGGTSAPQGGTSAPLGGTPGASGGTPGTVGAVGAGGVPLPPSSALAVAPCPGGPTLPQFQYHACAMAASGVAITPPDSPQGYFRSQPSFNGDLDSVYEKFAVKCSDDCPRREIYFLALIDILTHYGMKKRSAQAAKTVKYGAGAEISTVKPEQYARRFTEFIDKIIV